eukprot:gene10352-12242_t
MSDDEDDFGDVYETKPAVSSSAEASLPSESDIKATTTITSLQDTEEDDLYDELYGDADTPAETSVAEKAHTATEVVTSECQTPHKDVHAPTEEPTPVTSHEVQQEVVPAQAPLPPPAQPAFNDDDDDGFNIIMDKEVGYEVQEEDDDDGFNIVMDSDVPAAGFWLSHDPSAKLGAQKRLRSAGGSILSPSPDPDTTLTDNPGHLWAAALEMPPPFVPEGPWGSIERFDEAGRRKLPGGKGGWKFIPPEEYREFLALGHG